MKINDCEEIGCPSCGRRQQTCFIYVCRRCRAIYCNWGCGFGADSVCPNSDCGNASYFCFDDYILTWLEQDAEASASHLGIEAWIIARLKENYARLGSVNTVAAALATATCGLPFSFAKHDKLAHCLIDEVVIPQLSREIEEAREFLRAKIERYLLKVCPPGSRDIRDELRKVKLNFSKPAEQFRDPWVAIDHAEQVLRDSVLWSFELVETCRTALDVVSFIREMSEPAQRLQFVEHCLRLWKLVQWHMSGEIEFCETLGESGEANVLRKQLLEWLEQFENRLILERSRLLHSPCSTGSVITWVEQSNAWGVDSHWVWNEVSGLETDDIVKWLEDRAVQTSLLRPLCLTTVAREGDVQPIEEDDLDLDFNEEIVASTGPSLKALSDLLPEQCVWIRTYFEVDGTLHWSAWFKARGKATCIGSGNSRPDALSRLAAAIRDFDEATNCAWISSADSDPRPLSEWPRFTFFNQALQNRSLLDTYRERGTSTQLRSSIAAQLDQLPASEEAFRNCGYRLLEWLFQMPAALTPPEADWMLWHASAQPRRHLLLDQAFDELMAVMQQEFVVNSLHSAKVDWANTDVLFQVSGPLLVMPLAWLPLDGTPLYQAVASSSSIVSLSLLHHTANAITAPAAPSKRMLSVIWEEPSNRPRAHGLPLLHAVSRRLAKDNKWDWRALGDQPKANAANLEAALIESFDVVIVGAHGDAGTAAVSLADGSVWDAAHANRIETELLVLCCCAVGRLTQNAFEDVQGLCARLSQRGTKCLVAARWPIADLEAAILLKHFLSFYFENTSSEQRSMFANARAFNKARKCAMQETIGSLVCGRSLIGAFEIYGL